MMNKKMLVILLTFCWSVLGFSQETFPYNGVYDQRDGLYAFTNATIFKSYNEKIENAVLLIRKGKVEAVGKGISIPADAVRIDLAGKYIYPSFIDMQSTYGIPEAKRQEGGGRRSVQMLSNKTGAYSWNQALQPEYRSHENFNIDDKAAKEYKSIGFGAVLAHRRDGISRGSSTLVTLGDDRAHEVMVKEIVAHHLSFKKGVSTQSYPGSLMGGIALLRQTYSDATWYKKVGHTLEKNISLQSWNDLMDYPQIFEVRDRLEALRASKIAQEFGLNYIFVGNGDEYKRIEKLKGTQSAFIIPLSFPDAYDVNDPYDAKLVSLGDMKHWELAPSNAGRLVKAGVSIALTCHGLKKKSSFLSNLRKAIKNGLSETEALKALTHTPAKLMKADDQLGSLEKGKIANFIICSENVFSKDAVIHHNWINGKALVFKDLDATDLSGGYNLTIGLDRYDLRVKKGAKNKMQIKVNDSTDIDVKHTYSNGLISLSFSPDKEDGLIRLSGTVENDKWSGNGNLIDGSWVTWKATATRALPEKEEDSKKDKKKKEATSADVGSIVYPFMAYGWSEKPTAKTYVIKNATVWTSESDGILENTDVLVSNGKIKAVGKDLPIAGAVTIDGTGKHLTCGIIDEHSHIAISRGVNECTQENTAEVSIADVVNSEDINIYRQLAGGVTTVQLLHGSCNPIGGQAALIKMRWGFAPEDMKFKNADGFIKFALGENVKRSYSSSNNRFPNSRMGVERVYLDAFTRAKEYEQKKKSNAPDFRKDLEMETMVEILNSKRFVTCHSYVQSEINMLMHVADQMGFKINTFTHILEGYKIADKMKAHGAGGSSFADWWAYKYEVIDAIPYNGAILHNEGVVTAYNSDDVEMARRLNHEAAKAVMYGDLPEEEAWKFVTLNPAKLLHIDDQVGSIKVGKDGDLVLWSDNPLSIYSKVEMTFIDGIKFYDLEEDKKLRAANQKERARLIQKMISAKNGGSKTQAPRGKREHHYHCDDGEDEMAN